MQSDQVRCAAAIGICSPVIVVAPVVLRELDDAELDRILVHEWAHIQRRDDIARVFQFLVNAVAGFNPAVWWISRRLDLEREVACDDLVIETTGSRRAYAKSLMKLAGIPERPLDLTLVSAALSAPALTSRILRLLDDRRNVSTGRSTMTLAVAASGLLILALVLAGTQPVTLMATTTQIVSSSDEIFLPISSTTVNEAVIPVDRASSVPRASADSNIPPQGQELIRDQKELVASISNEPIAKASETVPLTGRPLGFDATAPVSLADHSLALSPSTKGTTETPVAPWTAAANAGKALGRSSQERAVGAATFFTRIGKNIGGAF
jgi:Zn-dependent protease with chaperone function